VRRLAVYGDVHANLPALEAVLADITGQGVSERYCLGDLVGYGPHPGEVIALVRAIGDPVVQGNYDRAIGARLAGSSTRFETPEEVLDGGESYAFTIAAVSADDIAFLSALPREYRIWCDGMELLLCHGSPRHVAELIEPETPPLHLVALAREARVDAVACGHSHVPFHRAVPTSGGVCHWVNAGSVGRPRDGDPRSAWVEVVIGTRDEVLEIVPEDTACRPVGSSQSWFGARVHRVAYDVESVIADSAAAGLPATLIDGLRTGSEERTVMAPSSVAQRVEEPRAQPSSAPRVVGAEPEHEVAPWAPSAARSEWLNVLASRAAAYEALAVLFDGAGNTVGAAVRRLRNAMRHCRTGSTATEAALTDAFQDADIALRTAAGHAAFESERERLYGECDPFDPFGHVLSASELTYLSGEMADNAAALRGVYAEHGFCVPEAEEHPLRLGHISAELRFMAHCLKRAMEGSDAAYRAAHDFFASHLADWAVLFAVVTGREAREPVTRFAGLALDRFLVCESAAFRSTLPEFSDAEPTRL
jgi:predicted phosphodiesterase